HNFGHGQQHLASLLATLNILSFLFHTVLDLLDQKSKLLRAHLPTRKTFFEDLRALTRYMYFDPWDHLLTFMLQGLELEIPPNSS
ncbi:MAG: ISNCY family transposase, partial [Cyanobacteria bacterium P01_F01_bin.56]